MTDSALSALPGDSSLQVDIRRFPSLVGILLGLSLSLHLAALVYFAFGSSMQASTCFLTAQFLLGISLLRLIDGAFVLQDIRLSFLVFLFLYGATLPLAVTAGFAGGITGLPGAAFMYGTAILGFNVVQWWFRQPWRDVPRKVFDSYRPSFANAIVVFLALGAIIAYAVSRGMYFSLAIDRGKAMFIGTQLWIVSNLLMNGLVMYMIIGWTQLTKQARWVVVVSVVAFVTFQISIGNRRDFLAMFIFLAGLVATRRHSVIRLRTILIGFLLFVALTIFGAIRQAMSAPMLLLSDPVNLLLTQSEFVSPIQTLIYYVAKPHALRLGWTYLSAPSLFVPRVFWPEKPESLSLQFMRDAFGTTGMMGYAYTPVTEALVNFGSVGPFIVFSILSILMVKLVKNADLRPGFYFIAFSMVVDFNRGDVGGLFYSIVVIGTGFWFMGLVSRLRWAPSVLREAWPADAVEPAAGH